MANALLLNYEYCFGCHSCEVACKNAQSIPLGQWGIKLSEMGPFKKDDGTFEWQYIPQITSLCNLCEDRVAEGKDPSCVHHCLAFCLEYGTVEEMAKRAAEIGSKVSVLIP